MGDRAGAFRRCRGRDQHPDTGDAKHSIQDGGRGLRVKTQPGDGQARETLTREVQTDFYQAMLALHPVPIPHKN